MCHPHDAGSIKWISLCGNNKKEKIWTKSLERSDQVFYQYEARKVFDYLKEKGVKI